MPKVAEKHKVLGTAGDVVLYGSGTSVGKYFYREWHKDTKTYRTQLLADADCLDDAITAAVEVSFRWRSEGDVSTQRQFSSSVRGIVGSQAHSTGAAL